MDNHQEDSYARSKALGRLCKLLGVELNPYDEIGAINSCILKLKKQRELQRRTITAEEEF
jgi:hypothetical protein